MLLPIFAGRCPETMPERAREMRSAVETPAEGDVRDRPAMPPLVTQLTGAFFQSPAQYIGGRRFITDREDHAEIAIGQFQALGNDRGAERGIAQILFDKQSHLPETPCHKRRGGRFIHRFRITGRQYIQ